jgi:hypothetical protein
MVNGSSYENQLCWKSASLGWEATVHCLHGLMFMRVSKRSLE